MKLRDLWRLAALGLLRRPVRAALTALGLAVALGSMVVFLALGEGLRGVFSDVLGSVGPDLQVTRTVGSAPDLLPRPDLNPAVLAELRAVSDELGLKTLLPVAVSLRQSLDPAQSAVFYGLPAATGIGAVFTGVRVERGRLLGPGDEGQDVAVLGARAAQNLGLTVGDTLAVNRRSRARVVGILQAGNTLTDTFTFLPLDSVQRAFGVGDRLSLVAVGLRRPAEAGQVAAVLNARLGPQGLTVSTRAQLLGTVGKVLRSADVLSVALSVIALLVGGLSVVNTVMMGVFERTREFGTLRAIGARPTFVRALVLTETLLLSAAAGVAGLGLSLLGVRAVNVYTRHLAGIDAAALTPRLALLALAVALALGLLAGVLPARNAGRLSVTAALGRQ